MTKKSQARLNKDASDKEFKRRLDFQGLDEDNIWEHLEQAYQNACGLFAQYHKMNEMVASVIDFIADGTTVANLLKALAADTTVLAKETEEQHAKHAGRTGKPDGDDDNYTIIMLQQNYQVLLQNHQLTVLPVMLQLDEHLQKAIRAKERFEKAQREEAAALDKNVVTDVEAVPVPTELAVPAETVAVAEPIVN